MYIELIGRFILLVIGVFFAFVATWSKLKNPTNPNAKISKFLVIFAVLCIGLGAFGQMFMPQYTSWLEGFTNMVTNPGQESYATFFNSVGKEKIPVELQKIGIDYAISNPIEGMETILNNSIKEAPDNKDGEKVLKWALESYKGKQEEINRLIEEKIETDVVKNFSPMTIRSMHDRMKKLPSSERTRLGISSNLIKEYEGLAKPFPITE